MNIRERFEEIWPVPDYAIWCRSTGMYWYLRHELESPLEFKEWNLRLDTFTRCQETMGPVLSLVDELIKDLEWINEKNEDHYLVNQIDRAKQIIEQKK